MHGKGMMKNENNYKWTGEWKNNKLEVVYKDTSIDIQTFFKKSQSPK